MKCKDCKHCAYVNDGTPSDFVTKNGAGLELIWREKPGGYCMLMGTILRDIQQCTAYEKGNLKIKR